MFKLKLPDFPHLQDQSAQKYLKNVFHGIKHNVYEYYVFLMKRLFLFVCLFLYLLKLFNSKACIFVLKFFFFSNLIFDIITLKLVDLKKNGNLKHLFRVKVTKSQIGHFIDRTQTRHFINRSFHRKRNSKIGLSIDRTFQRWTSHRLKNHREDISQTGHFINKTFHRWDISQKKKFKDWAFHRQDISKTG